MSKPSLRPILFHTSCGPRLVTWFIVCFSSILGGMEVFVAKEKHEIAEPWRMKHNGYFFVGGTKLQMRLELKMPLDDVSAGTFCCLVFLNVTAQNILFSAVTFRGRCILIGAHLWVGGDGHPKMISVRFCVDNVCKGFRFQRGSIISKI